MDEFKKKWFEHYSKLSLNPDPNTLASGRHSNDSKKEKFILADIIAKLTIEPNDSILDIGCGYGLVAFDMLQFAILNKSSLTLMDFPNVIDALQKYIEKNNISTDNIQFIKGIFPEDCPIQFNNSFDKIISYGVILYTKQPDYFIDEAIKLLKPNGKLLIGDVTNVNKKGRFLASSFGRAFDANYKGIDISDIKLYPSHLNFVKEAKKSESINTLLNDEFILRVIKKYRKLGYDVYVLPQNNTLPFSYTREDILICRND
jgi:cyclopropane fatty-acyl-phospholipid synthase-like methyltransferase